MAVRQAKEPDDQLFFIFGKNGWSIKMLQKFRIFIVTAQASHSAYGQSLALIRVPTCSTLTSARVVRTRNVFKRLAYGNGDCVITRGAIGRGRIRGGILHVSFYIDSTDSDCIAASLLRLPGDFPEHPC